LEIKIISEKDYSEVIKLSEYAFQYKIPNEKIPSRKEMLKGIKLLGIWDEGQLAAKLHIIPLGVLINGEEWKMGGIGGVATYPEYRRGGYVKSLMQESLKQMQQEGQFISLLHPFDISFYRKFGWEILSDIKKITIEKVNLIILGAQQGSIKRSTKETHNANIEWVYRQYSRNYMGMLVRDTKWWENHVYDEDSEVAVYYNPSKEAMGYILYNVKERKMDVQEMVALNQEARIGLWNFICQHDSMVESVTFNLLVHDPFPYFLHQPKLKIEVQPYFMARIVNAEECLKRFQLNQEIEPVLLHLDDPFAPWNNGSYLIGAGNVTAIKETEVSQYVDSQQTGIHLTINDLSAIMFGYRRPIELYELGNLIGTRQEIDKLEKMVPNSKSAFYDFF
jgi:predicted acetyltransferase